MHTKLDHLPEATKLVTDAMHEFAGTPEEVRVVVANSEIAMKRGDTEAAIHMLGNIPPDSSSYTKAQMVKADILLKVWRVVVRPCRHLAACCGCSAARRVLSCPPVASRCGAAPPPNRAVFRSTATTRRRLPSATVTW